MHIAFDAREVAGEVLTRVPALMEAWKQAAQSGAIRSVTSAGRSYAVVSDPALVARIRAASPQMEVYRYDEDTETLSDAAS